jgi:hypothetical protein
MPNYCQNNLTIIADKDTIDKLEAAYNEGELLEALRPQPTYEGYMPTGSTAPSDGMPDWWNWRIANWGTKWDVGGEYCDIERISDTEIYMVFDSAWSPPVAALRSRDDISYRLYYCEFGMAFCGIADGSDGFHDDETYEIGQEPQELTERFNIADMMEDEEE